MIRWRSQGASALLLGQHLAKGHCKALLELDISRNRLGDRGSEALLEAMSLAPNKLLSIGMKETGVSEKNSERFANFVVSNSRIKSLVRANLLLLLLMMLLLW